MKIGYKRAIVMLVMPLVKVFVEQLRVESAMNEVKHDVVDGADVGKFEKKSHETKLCRIAHLVHLCLA